MRALLAAASLVAVLLQPGVANAATLTVTTTDEFSATDCTLGDAITAANLNSTWGQCAAGAGDDTIDITATGTMNLTGSLPPLTTNITINGPGASMLRVHWAVIAPDASILAQSGGIDVEGASGGGVYWINFPTTVTDKAAVATVRAASSVTGEVRTIPCGGPPLGQTCAVGPNNASELLVSTHDSAGATSARSFFVAVIP